VRFLARQFVLLLVGGMAFAAMALMQAPEWGRWLAFGLAIQITDVKLAVADIRKVDGR
jgi:hypothetical protein